MNSEPERFVVPAQGLRVVDPATGQALPEAGATVRGHAEYWVRRVRDGDVTEKQRTQVRPTRAAQE